MPTLFRLLTTLGVAVALGYAVLFSLATFLRPEPRMILQAIDLPRDATMKTGRSAAVDRPPRWRQPSRQDR